jgi:glutathione-specific gamma-glutamylcyclotransferase
MCSEIDESRQRVIRRIEVAPDDEPLWVFGYGSLMWNPGFEHDHREVALVHGLHRRLCVGSIRYRGTPESPGLVLGLDLGGSCRGYAYRVGADSKHAVAGYLEERELFNDAYQPVFVRTRLAASGRRIFALTFRVRRDHPQYTPPMDDRLLAERIARCRGQTGCNPEYVFNTVSELRRMGFEDGALMRVVRHLETLVAPGKLTGE